MRRALHKLPGRCQCSPVAARGHGRAVVAAAADAAATVAATAASATAADVAGGTPVAAAAAEWRKQGRRRRSQIAVRWTPGGRGRIGGCRGPDWRCHS